MFSILKLVLGTSHATLCPPSLKVGVILSLLSFMFHGGTLSAQCTCTTTYSIGTAHGRPDLTSAIAYYGIGFGSLTGACIEVDGVFTIDASQVWNLISSELQLTTTGRIIVTGGSTLTANSSNFYGCGVSWLNITAQTGSTTYFDQCRFSKANTALYVAGTANFIVQRSTFLDNTNGIDIRSTQAYVNHLVENNQFLEHTTGIIVKGANVRIGYNLYNNTTLLANVGTGIYGEFCTNLRIVGGSFFSHNRAVELKSATNTLIRDITTGGEAGVFSTNGFSTLNIRASTIREAQNGIEVLQHQTYIGENVTVDSCFVSTNSKTGVHLETIQGQGQASVLNSTIQPTTNAALTYYGIHAFKCAAINGIHIENNQINHGLYTLASAPGGIYINGCKKRNIVRNNTINATYGAYDFGISVVHSPNTQIVGNVVDGSSGMNRAISLENNSNNTLLCCNYLDNSQDGLYVMGNHDNFDVFSTIFNRHNYAALHYDLFNTSLGATQPFRGNNWSNASGMWDSYYTGGNSITGPLSMYSVDPSFYPNGLTKTGMSGGAAAFWFNIASSSEADCVNSSESFCGVTPLTEVIEEEEELLINGIDLWAAEELADPSLEVMHWEAKYDAYSKLRMYSNLRIQHPELEYFYNSMETGNAGQLVDIEIGMDSLFLLNFEERELLLNTWMSALNELTPENILYENLININILYIELKLNSEIIFDGEQMSLINSVAEQCPQVAGRAVYLARFLQERYKVPTWNMNCTPIQERQDFNENINVVFKKPIIAPNPTFGQSVVFGLDENSGPWTVKIYDLSGKLMFSSATNFVADGQLPIELNTSIPGLYVVEVCSDHIREQFKLAIKSN